MAAGQALQCNAPHLDLGHPAAALRRTRRSLNYFRLGTASEIRARANAISGRCPRPAPDTIRGPRSGLDTATLRTWTSATRPPPFRSARRSLSSQTRDSFWFPSRRHASLTSRGPAPERLRAIRPDQAGVRVGPWSTRSRPSHRQGAATVDRLLTRWSFGLCGRGFGSRRAFRARSP